MGKGKRTWPKRIYFYKATLKIDAADSVFEMDDPWLLIHWLPDPCKHMLRTKQSTSAIGNM